MLSLSQEVTMSPLLLSITLTSINMKFITTNPITPKLLTFEDVPVKKFYVDFAGDLMFKISNDSAVRIARYDGELCGCIFNPSWSFGVRKILPYDKVEF